MKKYLRNYKSPGAVFFGVCGGKLSEGIDFSDDMARLVVIVGIPYGYLGDCRNKSKMDYLDTMSKRANDARFKLEGNKWYEMKAMRSISQAIGRVIRHKNDFGSILLMDERMESKARLGQLSSWLRDEVKVEDQFIKVIKPLRQFFKDREESRAAATSQLELQAIKEYEEDNDTRVAPVLQPRELNVNKQLKPYKAPFVKPTESKTKPSMFASGFQSHYMSHSFSNICQERPAEAMEEEHDSRSRMISFMHSDEKENSQSKPMHEPDASNHFNSRFTDSVKTIKPENKKVSVPAEEVPDHICKNLAMLDEKVDSQELKTNPELRDMITKMYKKLNPSEELASDCKICFEKRQLYSAMCGHVACKTCWDEISKRQKESGKSKKANMVACPFCKKETMTFKLRKVFT